MKGKLMIAAFIIIAIIMGISVGLNLDKPAPEPFGSYMAVEEPSKIEAFVSRYQVKKYIISTGLAAIRLKQTSGALSENETGYDWDCDDYAIALAEQARKDGKPIGLFLMGLKSGRTYKVHMTNYVIIGNRIEVVSAQTGSMIDYWYGVKIKVD